MSKRSAWFLIITFCATFWTFFVLGVMSAIHPPERGVPVAKARAF